MFPDELVDGTASIVTVLVSGAVLVVMSVFSSMGWFFPLDSHSLVHSEHNFNHHKESTFISL
jgi:hypothetical protein